MTCGHCAGARRASVLAARAALKGDIGGATEQVRKVGAHIAAKLMDGSADVVALQRDWTESVGDDGVVRFEADEPYAIVRLTEK